ncbi:MAG: hypothetical protein R3A11_04230 [Bdellovibrionota bacterium]
MKKNNVVYGFLGILIFFGSSLEKSDAQGTLNVQATSSSPIFQNLIDQTQMFLDQMSLTAFVSINAKTAFRQSQNSNANLDQSADQKTLLNSFGEYLQSKVDELYTKGEYALSTKLADLSGEILLKYKNDFYPGSDEIALFDVTIYEQTRKKYLQKFGEYLQSKVDELYTKGEYAFSTKLADLSGEILLKYKNDFYPKQVELEDTLPEEYLAGERQQVITRLLNIFEASEIAFSSGQQAKFSPSQVILAMLMKKMIEKADPNGLSFVQNEFFQDLNQYVVSVFDFFNGSGSITSIENQKRICSEKFSDLESLIDSIEDEESKADAKFILKMVYVESEFIEIVTSLINSSRRGYSFRSHVSNIYSAASDWTAFSKYYDDEVDIVSPDVSYCNSFSDGFFERAVESIIKNINENIFIEIKKPDFINGSENTISASIQLNKIKLDQK